MGAHVGILQRGGEAKLDREGRDYWIKPLRELGAVLPVYLEPKTRTFLRGHLKAKSPNCAYRLDESFADILRAKKSGWPKLLAEWAEEDAARERASLQATLAAEAQKKIGSGGHTLLIQMAVKHYVPRFLLGFKVLYVDDGDGDRITAKEETKLANAGIVLELRDAMPDILLWNPTFDRIWVIEAVTSDGEVDTHKVQQLQTLTQRCGKTGIDFTTAYPDWKTAAGRQAAYKNIAPGTYVWIAEDGSKQFKAETFQA